MENDEFYFRDLTPILKEFLINKDWGIASRRIDSRSKAKTIYGKNGQMCHTACLVAQAAHGMNLDCIHPDHLLFLGSPKNI